MSKVLRPYQELAIEHLRDGIRGGTKRQVLQLCTGAGKTLIAANMTNSAMQKGRRVMFLCDRIELIEQASARFDEEGVPHGVIQGNHWRWRPQELVQIATVQTLVNREFTLPDLVFVDECHGGGKRLNDFVQQLGCYVIGLSATPFSRGLGLVYQRLVTGPPTSELIKLGNLVPPIVYAPSEPDLTGVKVVAGEWQDDALAEVMDQPLLIGDIVATWLQRAQRRQTILFAVNVAHSKHLVEKFQEAGINAEHVDGYTGQREREMIIARFRRGDTELISNVGILDRGFDVPSASCCIYARPIKTSLSLYIQMGGRVLRAYPGKKNALILDHSGNTIRHGFLTDPLPEELDDGKPKNKSKAKPKLKEPARCPSCSYVKPRGVHACPMCGFAPAVPNEVFAEAGELVEIKRTEDKRQLYAEIRFIAMEHGYSEGWMAHTFKKMAGTWPNAYKSVPPVHPSDWTRRRVRQLLSQYHRAQKAKAAGRSRWA